MTTLTAWLAARLLPVRAFLGKVPSWAWIALAIAVAAAGGLWWHHGKVKAFGNERYAAGEAARNAEITALQTRLNAANGKQVAKIRSKVDEETGRNNARADAIQLRGPGKAACTSVAGLPAAARGSGKAAPEAAAPVAGLRDGERPDLIALPFAPTVIAAKNHDNLLIETEGWHLWYKRLSEQWAKAGADAAKAR